MSDMIDSTALNDLCGDEMMMTDPLAVSNSYFSDRNPTISENDPMLADELGELEGLGYLTDPDSPLATPVQGREASLPEVVKTGTDSAAAESVPAKETRISIQSLVHEMNHDQAIPDPIVVASNGCSTTEPDTGTNGKNTASGTQGRSEGSVGSHAGPIEDVAAHTSDVGAHAASTAIGNYRAAHGQGQFCTILPKLAGSPKGQGGVESQNQTTGTKKKKNPRRKNAGNKVGKQKAPKPPKAPKTKKVQKNPTRKSPRIRNGSSSSSVDASSVSDGSSFLHGESGADTSACEAPACSFGSAGDGITHPFGASAQIADIANYQYTPAPMSSRNEDVSSALSSGTREGSLGMSHIATFGTSRLVECVKDNNAQLLAAHITATLPLTPLGIKSMPSPADFEDEQVLKMPANQESNRRSTASTATEINTAVINTENAAGSILLPTTKAAHAPARKRATRKKTTTKERRSSPRLKAAINKALTKKEKSRVKLAADEAYIDHIVMLNRTNQISDTEMLQRLPKKPRRKAKFDNPSPSRFCHVCCRTPKNVRLAVCSYIKQGVCRKVVCERCFKAFELGDFEEAVAEGSVWQCTHCVGYCPGRSQCGTYGRINDNLRVERIKMPKGFKRVRGSSTSPGAGPSSGRIKKAKYLLPKTSKKANGKQQRGISTTVVAKDSPGHAYSSNSNGSPSAPAAASSMTDVSDLNLGPAAQTVSEDQTSHPQATSPGSASVDLGTGEIAEAIENQIMTADVLGSPPDVPFDMVNPSMTDLLNPDGAPAFLPEWTNAHQAEGFADGNMAHLEYVAPTLSPTAAADINALIEGVGALATPKSASKK